MSTPIQDSPRTAPGAAGRPRDSRIDDAVLAATVDLLEEVGYLRLTFAAIAERAGTNKPAIYRRWPTKADLVHEAVFPAQGPEFIPVGDDLHGEIRALVCNGLEVLGRPAARAAVPGLLAETSRDPDLFTAALGRTAASIWGWLEDRLARGVAAGEVRPDVSASTVFEMVAGAALIAVSIRRLDEIDPVWIDEVVELIVRGIAA